MGVVSAEAIARLRKRVRLHRVGMSHVPETCDLCAIRALLEAYTEALDALAKMKTVVNGREKSVGDVADAYSAMDAALAKAGRR